LTRGRAVRERRESAGRGKNILDSPTPGAGAGRRWTVVVLQFYKLGPRCDFPSIAFHKFLGGWTGARRPGLGEGQVLQEFNLGCHKIGRVL
jgi:hypothetical protein